MWYNRCILYEIREGGRTMERTELPIAVFDSGLGGISVLRALVQRLPGEDFLYFGDSANAPYGVRPVAEVRRLTQDVIGRLYDRGIKAAVIACNTATSAAIGPLRAAFPDIPVIGIEPALKPAVAHHRRVLVLATPLTLREEKFVALMHQCAGCAEIVPLPCPELVEFVERGELDSPALTAYLARQLGPYAGRVDAAVLGCTLPKPFRPHHIFFFPHLLADGTFAENREESSFIWENFYDEEERINEYDLTLFIPEGDELYRRYTETHYQRNYETETLLKLLKNAGFIDICVYDDYTDAPLCETSERAVFVAKKSK